MKVTAIISAAIATVGLAACGATVTPTASPTLAPTAAATIAPRPTATPAAPTPTPDTAPAEPPTLTALCAPSPMEFAWRVSFGEPESNYNVDLSFTPGATFTTEEKSATQPFTFDTPETPDTTLILLRRDSFPSAGISVGTNADRDLCNPALLPPPTIVPLCRSAHSVYEWQVSSITQQVNWNFDIRYSLAGAWTSMSTDGNSAVDFTTPASAGKRLYVRWDSYPVAGTSTAQADTSLCP